MKAIAMTAPGGAEVLQQVELEQPQIAAPTEVLVRVQAAGINPVDTKIRSRGPMREATGPTVLGCDGAGVVEAVGAEVTLVAPGDRVWYCSGGLGGERGNYAEFNVVDEALLQPVPAGLDIDQAAAAPLVLITAWEALHDRAGIKPGQQVLIHAGAGGVGHVAIQLAVAAGARVATTVSSAEKAEFVHQLGAECAINYREESVVEAIADWTQGRGVDIALDTVGPEVFRQTIPAMALYGDLVTILDPSSNAGDVLDLGEARLRNLRISLELMLTPQLRDIREAQVHQGWILRQCAELITQGRLRIEVSGRYPLAQAADAHRRLEAGGLTGKLVLRIDG
ncbi:MULTISPECIES: zinc-dependent alcohol dehydrogenase family protein [Thiorhodovibrio]|uniref:zinc-dependent alcohol dehydrogenase family protein n=1 Tax=Thiorhodovibrio TaxID=61593 RepID=UPI00191171D9|nr:MULTISPECIES: zinc-dependent alcohol dehydrogenase family protein [Thiorhodovibrio]MBK5967270.1 alcohol dehydrogenase [Thiorhodovibrio winogradskyi]WPL14476.1 Quinone oxidoreductase 1 [Thiorhodovibrio litoralis]